MDKLKVLDLFSGIGGFSLGLERTGGFKTVAFCEIENYPRRVLSKHWPDVPIHEDVRTLDGSKIDADVITGGYPCQPFSHAGKRSGEKDDRHLWPEMYRLIKSVRPRWVIAENVAGHITMGLDSVLSDLEAAGYAWWTFVVPACAVDAPHRRDRIWIIANNDGDGFDTSDQGEGRRKQTALGSAIPSSQQWGPGDKESNSYPRHSESSRETEQSRESAPVADSNIKRKSQQERIEQEIGGRVIDGREDVADTSGRRCGGEGEGEIQQPRRAKTISPSETLSDPGRGGGKGARASQRRCQESARWEPEPAVGRVAHGIPSRVDRLKGLGNAVVPQIPEMIGYAILERMND